jgi:energy-converting hydrogenase Eha subunit C
MAVKLTMFKYGVVVLSMIATEYVDIAATYAIRKSFVVVLVLLGARKREAYLLSRNPRLSLPHRHLSAEFIVSHAAKKS